MKGSVRLSLLALALTCTSSFAQRGVAPHNSMGGTGFGPVATAPPGNGFVAGGRPWFGPGRPGGCNRGNCFGRGQWRNPNYYSSYYWPGYGWAYSPYSAGLDPFWEISEPSEAEAPPAQQPSVIVLHDPEQKAASAPPASPKVVEVIPEKTADGKQGSSKPAPPAIFVLKSGQRIEAQRYLLTQDTLQVQHGRDRQSIPMNEVDVEATLAANRARGLDLLIPENKNQLTLGF